MHSLHSQYKALAIAGFITILLITGIANLSYATNRKSVLEFNQPPSSCALRICSLV